MEQKIIFWISGNLFSYVLANSLQNKIQGNFYAIIDITERPKEFFKEQKYRCNFR